MHLKVLSLALIIELIIFSYQEKVRTTFTGARPSRSPASLKYSSIQHGLSDLDFCYHEPSEIESVPWTCTPCSKLLTYIHKGTPCLYIKDCSKTLTETGMHDYSKCSRCSYEDDKRNCSNRITHTYDDYQCQSHGKGFQKIDGIEEHIPDICSADGIVYKNCTDVTRGYEVMEWIIVNNVFYPVQSLSYSDIITHSNGPPFTCASENQHADCRDRCLNGFCDGEEIFCKNYGCKKSECYCLISPNKYMKAINLKGIVVYPSCWGRSLLDVEREVKVQPKASMCPSCSLSCLKSKVHFSWPIQERASYRISGSGPSTFGIIETKTLDIKIPYSLHAGGSITLEIWRSKNGLITLETKCEGTVDCETIWSFGFDDYVQNPQCWSSLSWCVASVVSACFLYVVSKLFKIIKVLTVVFIVFTKYLIIPLLKFLSFLLMKVYRTTNSGSPVEYRLLEEQPVTNSPAKRSPSKFKSLIEMRRNLEQSMLIVTMVLVVLPISVSSCANSVSLTAGVEQCSTAKDAFGVSREVCGYKSSTRLALSPLGQRSCFTFKKPETESPIGSLQLQTNGIRLRCSQQHLYYTFEPKCIAEVYFNCPAAENCTANGCPSNWRENTDKMWPEHSKNYNIKACDNLKLNVNNGCFLASYGNSCTWSLISVPGANEEAYKVVKCNSWEYEVEVIVDFSSESMFSTERILLVPGVETRFNDFNINLVSLSTPPSDLFNDCFIIQGGRAAHSKCSEKNVPQSELVGQVQCTNEDDTMKSTNSCVFAESMFDKRVNYPNIECTSHAMNLNKLMETNALPIISNKLSVYYAPKHQFIYAEYSANALMEFQIDSNVKLSATISKSNCEASFKSISGCYGCQSGAIVEIEAKSSSGSILAELKCDNGWTTPASFSDEKTTLKFNFVPNDVTVKTTCLLKCPINEVQFEISGQLVVSAIDSFKSDHVMIGMYSNNATFSLPDLTTILESTLLRSVLTFFGLGFIIIIIVFGCWFKQQLSFANSVRNLAL